MSRLNEILINECNAAYTDDIASIMPYLAVKEGFLQNESFKEHKEYSITEWIAIFASYSVSYSWSDTFYSIYGTPAEELAATIPTIPENVKSRNTLPVLWNKRQLQDHIDSLLFSKTPLTPIQHELLTLVPIEFLTSAGITIKDTWMLVVKRLGDKAKFTNSKDVYRYCEGVDKFKTSEKKFVIKALNKLGIDKALEDMNPLKKEWMRIFKKLRYTTKTKMLKTYPTYIAITDMVYNDDFHNTHLSMFENSIHVKDYSTAADILAEKPGMFYRRVLDLGRYMDLLPYIKNTMNKVNTKTLIQVVFLLQRTERVITNVTYIIKALIENVKSRVPTNISINSLDLMTRAISFSDKEDENETMSGEFITFGSKLKVSSRFVRLGVAWKGPTSVDLDQHMLCKQGELYYGNPVLNGYDDTIIGLSSGDITENKKDIFSVELINVDTKHINEFTYKVNSYRRDPISENEVYVFVKEIEKFDENIKESRNVSIDLNAANHAIKVNMSSTNMTSIIYKDGYIQVLNRPTSEKLDIQINNIVLVKDLVALLNLNIYTDNNPVSNIMDFKKLVFIK